MMEIVSFNQGISVHRFSMEEVVPAAGVPYNTFTHAIQERYRFQRLGASAEAQQAGVTAPSFDRGEFIFEGSLHSIYNLDCNSDGLRAIANKTEVADAFIADLLLFAKESFGYRVDKIHKKPLYSSTALVRLSDKERSIFSFLDAASRLLEEEFAANRKKRSVEPFGFRLVANDEHSPPAVFIFEKRFGAETSEDIYFSQAPLPSDSHGRYLERLFSGNRKSA